MSIDRDKCDAPGAYDIRQESIDFLPSNCDIEWLLEKTRWSVAIQVVSSFYSSETLYLYSKVVLSVRKSQ